MSEPHNKKLSNKQVQSLRKSFDMGTITAKEAAKKYRVSETTIYKLLNGETYKDAGGPLAELTTPTRNHISNDEVVYYRSEFYNNRMSVTDVANKIGCSELAAKNMLYFKTYKHVKSLFDQPSNPAIKEISDSLSSMRCGPKQSGKELSENDRAAIREEILDYTAEELSDMYKVSVEEINSIVSNSNTDITSYNSSPEARNYYLTNKEEPPTDAFKEVPVVVKHKCKDSGSLKVIEFFVLYLVMNSFYLNISANNANMSNSTAWQVGALITILCYLVFKGFSAFTDYLVGDTDTN